MRWILDLESRNRENGRGGGGRPGERGKLPDADVMLGHRRRRWASITPVSGQRRVVGGHLKEGSGPGEGQVVPDADNQ